MSVLIIGASGYIGNKIYNRQKVINKNGNCIGTRYRSKDNEFIRFDILNDRISLVDELVINQNKHALICSADSNIEFCFKNKKVAYKKNVTATINLIKELKALGYHIVFLSTDNVFDGEKGNYTEKDIPKPINEYGKMKAEIEQFLIHQIPNSCIMRIGKIVGDFTQKKDLLVEWYNMALQKEKISCMKGNFFSLTHVEDIINSFDIIIERDLTGLYNIVGNECNSRKMLCQNFLKYMKLNAEVVEKEICEFKFSEQRPMNISMINTCFVNESGYKFMQLEDIYERFSKEYL